MARRPTPPKVRGRTRDRKLSRRDRLQGWERVTCPTCRGSGRRGNNICGLCGGDGKISALR